MTISACFFFLIFLSLSNVWELMHLHTSGWRFSAFWADVQWQLSRRAGDLGQWATHVSRVHLCRVYFSSSSLNSIFTDLSIRNSARDSGVVTGDAREHLSEIDRKVRKLIVSQDTSVEAQHYSSYTLPSPPLQLPGCLWGAFTSSFASKLLFLCYSDSWKAGVSSLFHWLLGRNHWYWSGPDTQQVHHHQHEPEKDFSYNHTECNQSAHINSTFYVLWGENFMADVWRIHVSKSKRQLYSPKGLFRLILEVTNLLPCSVELITHQ